MHYVPGMIFKLKKHFTSNSQLMNKYLSRTPRINLLQFSTSEIQRLNSDTCWSLAANRLIGQSESARPGSHYRGRRNPVEVHSNLLVHTVRPFIHWRLLVTWLKCASSVKYPMTMTARGTHTLSLSTVSSFGGPKKVRNSEAEPTFLLNNKPA